jgi:hypothetical protein
MTLEIAAAVREWFVADQAAALFAEAHDHPAFCRQFGLNPEDVYSSELWVHYREQARLARGVWLPNMGGRL